MSDDQTIANITKSFDPLEALIGRKGSNRSELWLAWQFLQVYAHYGLRLPTTTSDFAAIMSKSPAGFKFFPQMQEGNTTIRGACRSFLNSVFPKVIQVGIDLKSYAEDASSKDGEMFNDIIEMLREDDNEGALAFLGDLQDDAASALENAKAAQGALTTFGTSLSDALGPLDRAQKSLEADDKTNAASLDKLQGDAETEGSLKWYQAQIDELKARHTEAAVAAGTSPLYVWVLPPLGLIATGVVMGVYTDKAVKAMKKMKQFEDDLAKESGDLTAALAAQKIFMEGRAGLSNVVNYTKIAGEKCNTVKTAWDGITDNLNTMKKKIERTTDMTDEGEKVREVDQVVRYLRRVESKFEELIPDLKELLTDPYITVAPGQKSYEEVVKLLEDA